MARCTCAADTDVAEVGPAEGSCVDLGSGTLRVELALLLCLELLLKLLGTTLVLEDTLVEVVSGVVLAGNGSWLLVHVHHVLGLVPDHLHVASSGGASVGHWYVGLVLLPGAGERVRVLSRCLVVAI